MIRALRGGTCAALVAAAAFAGAARAAEPAVPKTYAVIVGVSKYADPQIKPRVHAEDDAKALYDLVTDGKHLTAAGADVFLLLGDKDEKRNSQPATKANILKAIHEVTAKATKDDKVIVSFVGQGAPLADRTCFLASDSTFKERATNGVASAEIVRELEKFKSEKLCVFIDVNLKGFDAGKDSLVEPDSLDMLRAFVGELDKEEHQYPPGRVVFVANANVSPSLDLPDQGLFTKVILDGMKGAADKDGYEADGVVTIDELETYLEKTLPQIARETGKTKDEKQQTPVVFGGRINHFVLNANPEVGKAIADQIAKVRGSDLPADVKDDGAKLLSRMPKLKRDQELRKLYQQVVGGTLSSDKFLAARTKNYAERKLSRDTAETFSKKVMEGVLSVRSNYVKELNQGEMVGWAVRGVYRRIDEKVPADIKTRLEGVKDLRRSGLESLLADVREALGDREDLDGNKATDIALAMMLINLDPYTVYIDKEAKQKADIDIRGKFTGIGIQIRRDMNRDGLLVVSPIKDSPGYKAGLQAGDLVTVITTDKDKDGKELDAPEKVSTKGLKVEDAVKRILGRPGSKIGVTVEREGAERPLEFEITRNWVEVETVMGVKRTANDTWDYLLDPASKIGYIRLTQFQQRSASDMEKAVKALEKAGMKGLVLDLRFNPGGLLTSAVQISDMFIDDGLIVTVRPRVGEEQPYYGSSGGHLSFPMVCLVNGGSASGSEIVSACLQDQGRAKIMGERSYGKGSVQNIMDFKPTEGEIKVTTATFWRPSNKNLNKSSTKGKDDEDWGVRPDAGYEVKLDRKELFDLTEHIRDAEIIAPKGVAAKPKDDKPAFKDRQLDKAVEYLHEYIKIAAKGGANKAG